MDIYSNTLNEEWYGAGIFVRANTTTLQQLNAIDDSEIEVKVPEGIQSGQRIRIKEKGMRNINNSKRGDLYIDVAVETPVKLSKTQIDALKEHFVTEKKVKVLSK